MTLNGFVITVNKKNRLYNNQSFIQKIIYSAILSFVCTFILILLFYFPMHRIVLIVIHHPHPIQLNICLLMQIVVLAFHPNTSESQTHFIKIKIPSHLIKTALTRVVL